MKIVGKSIILIFEKIYIMILHLENNNLKLFSKLLLEFFHTKNK